MSNRHNVSIFLLLFLSSFCLQAQQQLTGTVRDSLGQPVDFATVILHCTFNGQILAYTNTDPKGAFKLQWSKSCDSLRVSARMLGYLPAEKTCRPGELINLTLTAAPNVLREVVVREDALPISGNRDTTEFRVASFSDSTEFSVEDILKKLPGMQVDDNGRITFRGKPVERVLIDGDDMFSDNYVIGTRNIRADMISSVQAIDRYHDNPLLKDIRTSEHLVLNLKVKEDKKLKPSGSATLGSGWGDEAKWYGHANLFSLSSTAKTYLIANANNTGENPMGNIRFMAKGGAEAYLRGGVSLQNSPLTSAEALTVRPPDAFMLPTAYTMYNRQGVAYLGQIIPWNERVKTKVSGWVSGEKLKQDQRRQTLYKFSDEDVLDINEQQNQTYKNQMQYVQAETDFFAEKSGIRSFSNFSAQQDNDLLRILRTPIGDPTTKAESLLDLNIWETYHGLEWTQKTGNNQAVQTLFQYTYRNNNGLLNTQYDQFAPFFGLDSTFELLAQPVRQNSRQAMLTSRWLVRKGISNLMLETGFNHTIHDLESSISLETENSQTYLPDQAVFGNAMTYRQPMWFLNGSWARQTEQLRMNVKLNGTYAPVSLDQLQNQERQMWMFQPRANVAFLLSRRATLTASAQSLQRLPSPTDLFSGYLAQSYAGIRRGLSDLGLIREQNASLGYRFDNNTKQSSFNVSITAQQSNNAFGSSFLIDPYLAVVEGFRPIAMQNLGGMTGLSRYFSDIRSRFEVGLQWHYSREPNRVNSSENQTFEGQNWSMLFKYGSAFDFWLNVYVESSAMIFITTPENSSDEPLLSQYFVNSLKMVAKPVKNLSFTLETHQIASRNQNDPFQTFYAMDGYCTYSVPKWRSSFTLTGNNLLGAAAFERVSASTFVQNSSAVQAVPGFGYLSWSFQL